MLTAGGRTVVCAAPGVEVANTAGHLPCGAVPGDHHGRAPGDVSPDVSRLCGPAARRGRSRRVGADAAALPADRGPGAVGAVRPGRAAAGWRERAMIDYGTDHPAAAAWVDRDGTVHDDDDAGPLSVVPFPSIDTDALQGIPGKIVEAVLPHTEAHPAAILAQVLARFGALIGGGLHVRADNRMHAARIYPLVVGKTSDGAKGTSDQVAAALSAAAERMSSSPWPMRQLSGLSSGEGLIETVRDANGDDPSKKGYDEGIPDKRLLVVESEFTGALAVMERQGSTLPRVVREAWDGDVLRNYVPPLTPVCHRSPHRHRRPRHPGRAAHPAQGSATGRRDDEPFPPDRLPAHEAAPRRREHSGGDLGRVRRLPGGLPRPRLVGRQGRTHPGGRSALA